MQKNRFSLIRWVVLPVSALAVISVLAQTPAESTKKTGPARVVAPKAAEAPSAKGYRVGPRPVWVVDPPIAPTASVAPAHNASGGRRELLLDLQINHALPRMQYYLRTRSVAADNQALGAVSQPRINFNPAFQTVTMHGATITREGRTLDRLKDARIEVMRRETQLDRQMIDGTETLLVVLSDVRVGDSVELAYTVEGANPIFDNRIAGVVEVATSAPVDVLHERVIVPADRNVQVRAIGGDAVPERKVEGNRHVLSVLRTQVPAVLEEQATPPWFKVYPAWQYSEYASWAEVDAWARRLFAPAQQTGPLVRERVEAWRAGGLKDEALVADVLRFVQDEVRYFSVSLGESSHRPKPAERTLSERLGDCKDKVVLLNTLLTELGFDAKPALVSIHRNRGLANYLPTHDQFDHVVTQIDLNGRRWYLDGTITGQGSTLAERGHYPYGQALVVGAGQELQRVADRADHLDQLEFVQRWDLSKPGQPTQLTTSMRARGLSAERWRSVLAVAGEQRLAEALAGAHMRATPGLKANAAPAVKDDRAANTFEMTLSFEHPNFGSYSSGSLEIDIGALELVDVLAGPQEARRRMPFLLDQPKVATSRVEVIALRPWLGAPPAPAEVADRHFAFTSRVEPTGNSIAFVRRVERRSDEVQPDDLASFRESLNRARGLSGNRMRVGYLDVKTIAPEIERIERKYRSARDFRNDTLTRMLVRNEVTRAVDRQMLGVVQPSTPLAAQVLVSSSQAANLLGEFASGLADADAALAIEPANAGALDARGVALVGLGRTDEAVTTLQRLLATPSRSAAQKWLGSIEVFHGKHAEAEKLLRDVIVQSSGSDRDFALLWLYIAAEYQGRGGKAAIAPFVDSVDAKQWVGALLHYLDGRLDRDALLKRAREPADMERLNLAEAYFYIGQQLAARGERTEALQWFARSADTNAQPYREVTFAQLEMKRGR
jgi:lipoprotein NlpI